MKNFMTDRKRANGLGSAGQGTNHHWKMMVTSMLLLILVPLFVFTFIQAYGGTYQEVIAYYAQPLPAIILALTFTVIILHLTDEAQVAIEDYVHGVAGKLLMVALKAFSYTLIAVGLFAIAKLAFS